MLTSYRRARSIDEAIACGSGPAWAFVAGGTDLVPLLRSGVASPEHLVDLRAAGLPSSVAIDATGGAVLGAGAIMADVAAHPGLARQFPVLVQALLGGASAQVRNAASIGGNLLQRPRCSYFRDPAFPCNKRLAGSGCPARGGENRRHAVVGGSEACVAVHASDLAVALVALDAVLCLRGPGGERRIRLADFYVDPEDTPWRETCLADRELILSVEIPPGGAASAYVKVRDRASFDFALVSAAAVVEVDGGRIARAAVALGGVGPRPWRLPGAEARLIGQRPDRPAIAAALRDCLAAARPLRHNAFKIELARRAAARAIAAAGRPG